MKIKRELSILLAAAMVAGYFPMPLTTFAAEPTSATLSFDDGGGGASIVSGGTVGIKVVKPSFYREDTAIDSGTNTKIKSNGLYIEKSAADAGKLPEVSVGGGEEKKVFKISDGFFPDPYGTPNEAVLSIQGAYMALLLEGTVTENAQTYKLDDRGKPIPDEIRSATSNFKVTSQMELTVLTASSMTFTCVTSENQGVAPSYRMVPQNPDTDGNAFNAIVRVDPRGIRAKDTDPLMIGLADRSGNITEVALTPVTPHKVSSDGIEFQGSKRWIQKDTIFKLQVPQPASNKVMLTVISPKKAAEHIAGDIEAEAKEGKTQNFIQLAEGERVGFIRQKFKVAYDTAAYYNTKFYFDWKWVPKNEEHKDVVKFPLAASVAGGFETVDVRPVYGDAEGHVSVNISCRGRGTVEFPVLATRSFAVVIKGKGQPASLEAESQKIAEKTPVNGGYPVKTVPFPAGERDMPVKIQLNAYDGRLVGVEQPKDPCEYTIRLNMGKDNSASMYAVVTSKSGENLVTMKTTTGNTLNDYKFGDQILNPDADVIGAQAEGYVDLTFIPKKTGVRTEQLADVAITFYVKDANKKPILALEQPPPFQIGVKDDSPSNDATLRELTLKGKQGTTFVTWPEIDYGFLASDPEYDIVVENKRTAVKIKPTRNDLLHASETIKIKATLDGKPLEGYWQPKVGAVADEDGFYHHTVLSGKETEEIPLTENKTVKVELLVTAEDTSTQRYILNITQLPKSTDATLQSLTLTDPDKKILFNGIVKNKFEYDVEIPFKVQKAKVAYVPTDSMATATFEPQLSNMGSPFEKDWLDIIKYFAPPTGTARLLDFKVNLTAEDGLAKETYILHITRSEPSNINTLKELKLLDSTTSKNTPLTIDPPFTAGKEMEPADSFTLNVPYPTKKIKVQANPTDTGSTVILLAKGLDGGNIIDPETDTGGDGWMILGAGPSKAFTPKPYTEGDAEKTFYTALVEVWPESMIAPPGTERPTSGAPLLEWTVGTGADAVKHEVTYKTYTNSVMRYPVHIYRDPASGEAGLKSIELADQDAKAVPFLDFDPEKPDYTIEVPYEVAKISVKPTAIYDKVDKILVNGKKVPNGTASALIKLEEKETKIPIVVYPEYYTDSGRSIPPIMTYNLTIIRSAPSNDSRLVKLEVADATDFKPVFAPSKTSYSAKVAETAEGVKITATANHPAAKIEIDGVRVESGKQSELIRILELDQKVSIVVTAQDGISTTVYSVRFRNENLVEKTGNADLEDLEISPGIMRPTSFKSSLLDYEVTVDEETFDVDLFPVLADSYATMVVSQDGREIGDDDENFSGSLEDGENEFTIDVTSPDGAKEKTYTVLVYRNEEDKMGKLDPLDADEIDFKNSSEIIVVDIEKYSRISRDVFEELKTYPDKTIIFQGNDYSLEMKAKDLQKIIPNVEYFDFGMSFRSPLEEEVEDEIYSYSGNNNADLVHVYFKYHGALPAPAILSLNLGKQYRNSNYYWNYYNEERERMDYYGTVSTNSRGAFTLPIEHMSHFTVSDRMLAGAENKTGNVSAERDLTSEALVDKLIPNTGAEGCP